MTQDPREAGEARGYIAYLLRLWRERDGELSRWRASLQDPRSGERVGFARLEELFRFLRQETEDWPGRNGCPTRSEGKGV
jgi:hypothetical protein